MPSAAERYAIYRQMGRRAYDDGATRYTNPFARGGEAWCAWDNGWVESLDVAPMEGMRSLGRGRSIKPACPVMAGRTRATVR